MPSTSLVDVILPVYNAEATVAASVASLQAQTLRDIRIVAIDDGSTDASGDILRQLANQDPRIVVVSKANGGIVEALNAGLDHCSAPFAARLDADDISFPERLERQVAHLQRNPACVAVGCDVWHVDAEGRRTGTRTNFAGQPPADPFWVHSIEPYIMHPFLMARTEALRAVGGYRYAFHAEDTDLYWRLVDEGELHNLPDLLGEYRLHGQSISGSSALNGRISAVHSQLAAISAVRRRRSEPDFAFPKENLARMSAARELAAILDIAGEPLRQKERDYLALATASKLLDLSDYRGFPLSAEDRSFIKQAIRRHHRLMAPANKRQLLLKRIAATRLLRRRAGEIGKLAPLGAMAAALAAPLARSRKEPPY